MALACGKPPRLLETINPHLAGIDPARAVPLETVSATGELLTHWLYLPAAGDKKTPPLVVVPYPGMGFAEDLPPGPPLNAIQTAANPQLLAGHGYAVLRPAIPLSPGTGDPMARLHHEVQKAIDVAIATGRVDGSRVAVYGHSYGGYGALALATLSNRFSAVIGSAGVFDLASNYGDQFDGAEDGERTAMLPSIAAGWAESGQGRMGSPPWRDLDRYVRNSPYYRVERITSPVLLIHGDVDAVPVEQAERMFFALYRSGADALFVRYGGEGHALTSPANIRDSWRRIFSFLDEALAQDPPRTLPSRP
jgi:dipeptidyl aminopeptidase/acylaminoacyl peptidase